jgi:flagellar hook-associated protein 2
MSATSSTSNANALALSGLASGIDWTSIVNEMLTVEAAPETQMNTEETTDQQENSGFQTIGTDLTALKSDITTLTNPGFFTSRTTTSSNSSVATATAATGTAMGTYAFDVSHLATDSVQVGATASSALAPTGNVSGVTLSSAGFATPVTAGTFTVDNQTVTITTSESLQDVFTAISTATSGAVTASYNPTSDTSNPDTITLSSSSPITLGSDTDTSNFLQVAQLYANGTGAVTSTNSLGGVDLSDTLNQANFSQPLNITGAGEFTINGVAINYNASTTTVNQLMAAINSSSAGVTATYDAADNRFELTNTSTGDVGMTLQDVTGNFLAASGLSSGTLHSGSNLQYTINGSGTQTSTSNTVDGGTSGITGLSITATGEGLTNITVGSDTSTISSAISQFVSDYNTVQNYISSQTQTATSSTGTVTPGLFTGNMDVENIAFSLRQTMDASPGSSLVQNLNSLGILSNGQDNTLSLSDTSTLNAALTNNLSAVASLFTDPTTGIATTLNTYVNSLTSPNGVLATDEKNMTSEATTIGNSIKTLQAKITSDQTTLTNEFAAMETAIESINTDKQTLNDFFSASSSSASSQSAPTAAGSNISSGG